MVNKTKTMGIRDINGGDILWIIGKMIGLVLQKEAKILQ
jgi:hypothetical protein